MSAEQVVLVDDDGNRLGTEAKSTVHHADTPLHLGFSCYVVDSAGRVLLTTRAAGKTFPGVLTNSFCGHPAPDEPLEDAVRRRAADELGLTLTRVHLVLPDFRYRAEMNGIVENELCPVLVALTEDNPQPRSDEVAEIEWVRWTELRDDVVAGRRTVSPWFAEQLAVVGELPDDPLAWPEGDPSLLPAALTMAARSAEQD